jgi:hypothetical protein
MNNVKADGNVPFQNRPRFSIVGIQPTTIIQKMLTNIDFDGGRAKTVAQPNADLVDPTVTRGEALWSGLTNGGLFYLGGKIARPAIVESYYSKNCTATFTLVKISDPSIVTRAVPTTPFKLGVDECMKVISTGAGAPIPEVGIMIRLEGQRVL